MSSAITRKEIIEDEAINWGPEYAKAVQPAIDKNKEFAASILALNEANKAARSSNNPKELAENQRKANEVGQQTLGIWKEQNQLELALISTKKKNELATEGTNRALVKERTLLAETNKEIKLQAREQLGMVSSYEKLNRKRLEAQKVLANLLSEEKKNIAEIVVAQREFNKLDIRVKSVDATIKNYSKNIGNYQSAFDGLNGTMRNVLSTFGLVSGVALFGNILKDTFNVIREFDRQLIAVGKTTGISGEDLKQFGRDVVELGEKTDGISIQGLLNSSEVAGQLGVTGTENILKFSSAIEKLKLTSDIISDEQIGNFAKFIEVSSDSFENADRLASVITRLGNEMATTEAEVLGNATEIQKGVAVYNTSAQGVLALGAATSTLGSEAESSRSAIQKTFGVLNDAIATGSNLEKVLKLTGLTQKELSTQFNKDATGVFQKFVKGLAQSKEEGQNLSLVLKDLGISELRAFTVVGSLAANYGVLEAAMASASAEYTENIALNKEVEAASQSIDSILGDLNDKWQAYILSTNDANSGTSAITGTLKFLRDNLAAIINGIVKYGSVLLSFLAIQKAVNFVSAAWSALQVAATAAQVRFALSTGIGTKAILAQAAAARAAAVAQGTMNTAMLATPWGLIIGLVGAAVAAYVVFNDELSEHEQLLLRIQKVNEDNAEAEKGYSDARDSNRSRDFAAIEKEMELKRAQGVDAKTIDQEEVRRKKEVVQGQLDAFNMLKKSEFERTKNEIQQSELRIAQMEKEAKARNITPAKSDEIEDQIEIERGKVTLKKSALVQSSQMTIAEQKKLKDILAGLDKDASIKSAAAQKEDNEKAKREREKARKEYLASLKQAENDEFALREFRLKNNIAMNDEAFKDDTRSSDERIEALYDRNQTEIALSKESLEHKLKNISLYDDAVRDLTQAEIDTLVNGGDIKRQLLDKEKLAIEQAKAEQLSITKKYKEEEDKLIAFDASKFDKENQQKLTQLDTELQNRLAKENDTYKALLDGAQGNQEEIERITQEHEQRVFDIKKKFAIEGLQMQVKAIETLLATEKISAEDRIKYENVVANAKREIGDLQLETQVTGANTSVDIEKDKNERMKELAFELKDALVGLTNSVFDARISNIDNEIRKNDEYYAKQIELAGNDARQKDLLEKEREKKREALEKKKKKEEIKAAIFNKIMALANIGIQTAMASIAALAPPPVGLGPVAGGALLPYIIGLGAVQAAAVLATPLPKYKDGLKEAKTDHFAVTGDGGRKEVISGLDGSNPMLTPAKPTLTFIKKKQMVHKSEDEYNRFMRASIIANVHIEKQKMDAVQASGSFDGAYNAETVNLMKETIKAIKSQKQNVTVNVPKMDIGHEIWKLKQINWRA